MAEPAERSGQRRLEVAPLVFEPAEATADPEHFFDLESIDDPRELLSRATELTLAFRAATDRATEFQAIAAAQLADPRRFDRLTPHGRRRAGGVDRGLRPEDDRVRPRPDQDERPAAGGLSLPTAREPSGAPPGPPGGLRRIWPRASSYLAEKAPLAYAECARYSSLPLLSGIP